MCLCACVCVCLRGKYWLGKNANWQDRWLTSKSPSTCSASAGIKYLPVFSKSVIWTFKKILVSSKMLNWFFKFYLNIRFLKVLHEVCFILAWSNSYSEFYELNKKLLVLKFFVHVKVMWWQTVNLDVVNEGSDPFNDEEWPMM